MMRSYEGFIGDSTAEPPSAGTRHRRRRRPARRPRRRQGHSGPDPVGEARPRACRHRRYVPGRRARRDSPRPAGQGATWTAASSCRTQVDDRDALRASGRARCRAGRPARRLSAQHRPGRGPRPRLSPSRAAASTWPRTSRSRRRISCAASAAAGSAAPEGHPYHEQTKPPRQPGICDVDGSELYQRTDDQPATVQARLRQQLGVLGPGRRLLPRATASCGSSTVASAIDRVTADLLAAIAAGDRGKRADGLMACRGPHRTREEIDLMRQAGPCRGRRARGLWRRSSSPG